MSARPPFPKQSTCSTRTPGFCFVADRKELNHGVDEGKTATSRTLPKMLVRRPLVQAELHKCVSLGSAWRCADEYMIKFYSHARDCNS